MATTDETNRPVPGELEERQAPALEVDGKRLHGVIPYGTESRDLGDFSEVIHRFALSATRFDDLVVTSTTPACGSAGSPAR